MPVYLSIPGLSTLNTYFFVCVMSGGGLIGGEAVFEFP